MWGLLVLQAPSPSFAHDAADLELLNKRLEALEGKVELLLKGGNRVIDLTNPNAPRENTEQLANQIIGSQSCPTTAVLLPKKFFKICYDKTRKIPIWVGYELTAENLAGLQKRTDDFRPDLDLDESYRAQLSDYKGSGYDRGHMAPAAAFKRSKEAMSETFLLSNMAPQTSQLNRGAWRIIEQKVRNFVIKGGRTFVFTGNIYETENGQTVIGVNQVVVPTHSYKAILHLDEEKVWSAYAFVAPNVSTILNRNYRHYARSINDIEQQTSLDFFGSLPDQIENAIETNKTPLPE